MWEKRFQRQVVPDTTHLEDIADNIPELDNTSGFLLQLGRAITHHVLEQGTDPKGSPYLSPLLPRHRQPNTRNMTLNRTRTLVSSLKKNMSFCAVVDNGHAEVAARLTSDTERWYLPIFKSYHSKKVDQIRAVFDSCAEIGC